MHDKLFSLNEGDELLFSNEDESDSEFIETTKSENTWKLLIVDDEPAIHDVTKMALSDFSFEAASLDIMSAYSGEEAIKLLSEHPDIAVILLDVVMETDHAGLDVARIIREKLNNKMVRIILRTGQPGQAPEREVITNYDINSYKNKTELTATKLFSTVYTAIRAYRDLSTIEENRQGLERIIHSSSELFSNQSLQTFTEGVLVQLTSLMQLDKDAAYCHGLAATALEGSFPILAGIGKYDQLVGEDGAELLDGDILEDMNQALIQKKNIFNDDRFVGYFSNSSGVSNLLILSGLKETNCTDEYLLDLFIRNVSIAQENIELNMEMKDTQHEIVYMLGEAVETRSKETGNHVKRVAEISELLALKYGLSEKEAAVVKLASPLHDVGKIGIPDAILNKPGRHTDEERKIMQTHVQLGVDMLKSSKRRVLKAGAIIAGEHHEKWDGSGYPNGNSGEDIHIYGRISAIADVFDALGSDRCYKKAWPLDKILTLLKEESGKHFEPKLVELLHDNLDGILEIINRYTDTKE